MSNPLPAEVDLGAVMLRLRPEIIPDENVPPNTILLTYDRPGEDPIVLATIKIGPEART